MMTVSNGMLTFACPGMPKTLPKIDEKGFRKTTLHFRSCFSKKCSQRLPRGCPKGVENPSKIGVLTNLAPTGPTDDHFDRFLIDFGVVLDPKLKIFLCILHPKTNERTEPTRSYQNLSGPSYQSAASAAQRSESAGRMLEHCYHR